MRFWIAAISALVLLAGTIEGYGAVELISNGTFEGEFVAAGTSSNCDGLADFIPVGWTRGESCFTGFTENSLIGPFEGNGPSATGSYAVEFQRLTPPNSSGNGTILLQNLNVNVADYETLNLSIDAMVNYHNLEAGGWVSPASEWPLRVDVSYRDTSNNPQTWRHGWYLATPGDGSPNDPGSGLIPIYHDTLVPLDQWVVSNFNLLDELPQAQTITRILVGGAGWNYASKADNISMQGIINETVLIDIKPGSDSNPINLKSKGVLPVSILTTDDFDALDVDPETVYFGDPVLIAQDNLPVEPVRWSREDVTDDGLLDLSFKFSIPEMIAHDVLGPPTVEGLLTGSTFSGIDIEGRDSILIVPRHGSVPEPSTAVLSALGLLCLAAWRWKKHELS